MTPASPAKTLHAPLPLDRGNIEREIEEGADRLERASEKLYQAIQRFERAEEAFDYKMADLRIQADLAHQSEHKKLPSQDRRQDMALTTLRREHEDTYVEFFASKADVEALQARYRALEKSVNARQSVLRRQS
jgi:hypothetical protein